MRSFHRPCRHALQGADFCFTGVLYISIQGCGNSKIFYLSRDKYIAIMYLSNENFTCPIVQISLYLSVLKQFTLLKAV